MFSKIYKLYYILFIHIYVYKSFSTTLDKGLRTKKKERDEETGKHELKEMGTLNTK